MKKTLSIALSLIMIITTLAALPFSAHAASTSIYKVNLSYYFDDRDRINFAPTTSGQNFTVYSVNWEDQNGQPFNNDQIDADSDETYTLTVNLSANTGYDFSDNISVDFNGVRLQLKNWLKNTPVYLVLQWFDVIEEVSVSSKLHARRWTTELTERDKMFIRKLGMQTR